MRIGMLAAAGVCLMLAACSSGGSIPDGGITPAVSPSASDAQAMCRLALGDSVLSAGPVTTVGDIRSTTFGAGFRPAKNAFPGVSATAPAAWCWTSGEGNMKISFGVSADGQQVKLASVETSVVPNGPPVIK